MKYFANFNANNGTRLIKDISGTNRARIIKSIRSIAEGERFAGNECKWWVYDEEGREAASGGCYRDGQRFRTI